GDTRVVCMLKGPALEGANQPAMQQVLESCGRDNVAASFEQARAAGRRTMSSGNRASVKEDPCTKTRREQPRHLSDQDEEIPRQVGIPVDQFTALFAMSRIAGWAGHIMEQWADNRLIRPRGEYIGPVDQPWIPIDERG